MKGDKGHYNDWPVTTTGHYASDIAGIATDKCKYDFCCLSQEDKDRKLDDLENVVEEKAM